MSSSKSLHLSISTAFGSNSSEEDHDYSQYGLLFETMTRTRSGFCVNMKTSISICSGNGVMSFAISLNPRQNITRIWVGKAVMRGVNAPLLVSEITCRVGRVSRRDVIASPNSSSTWNDVTIAVVVRLSQLIQCGLRMPNTSFYIIGFIRHLYPNPRRPGESDNHPRKLRRVGVCDNVYINPYRHYQ